MSFKKTTLDCIFVLLILFISNNCFAQLIKNYGFKSGISYAWQTYDAGEVGELKYSGNRIGFSFGFYAEWLDNSFFSIKTELNLISKGMKAPDITGYAKEEERLNYLSFTILPNIYTEMQNVKIYAMAGPRIDVSVYKSLKANAPTYIYKQMERAQEQYKDVLFGITLGLGCEIKNIFPFIIALETRYSPDLSKIYDTPYLNTKNNSVEVLFIVGF